MYRVEVVDKRKVCYRRRTHNVVTDVVNSLLLLLVYSKIVLVLSVELVVGGELKCV